MTATAAADAAELRPCPSCGGAVPHREGWRPWCAACEWNLDEAASTGASAPGRWQRLRDAYGRRSSAALFDELRAQSPVGRRRPAALRSRSLLLAYAIATAVHASSAGIAVLAVAIWRMPWPNLFYPLLAATLPLLAWTLRPRMVPLPTHLLSRAQAPALHEAMDRLADAMGTRRPAGLGSEVDFNANFRRAGWRGRPYIELGVPLMLLMSKTARLGVFAHELSHGANGDPLRGRYLYGAVRALDEWASACRPASIGHAADGVQFGGPLASWAAIPFELAMLCVARLLEGLRDATLMLVQRESQRAEYWADRLAASVVGSAAMIEGLRELALIDAATAALERTAHDGGIDDLADALAALRAAAPPSEYERMERLWRRDHIRTDLTHPPTSMRLDLLAATPQPAAIVLPAGLLDALDAELRRLGPAVARELTNRLVVR